MRTDAWLYLIQEELCCVFLPSICLPKVTRVKVAFTVHGKINSSIISDVEITHLLILPLTTCPHDHYL